MPHKPTTSGSATSIGFPAPSTETNLKVDIRDRPSTIWNRTDIAVQKVKHIVFCGYSFPDADIHIKYLLKRAQTNRDGDLEFTVVNHFPGKDPDQIKQEKYRYERFLGKNVSYTMKSFQDFCNDPFDVIPHAGGV
jgi:hypothetical protein